ncbi:MAG: class I SAM-dependent methyltransferase [Nitrosomonadales bacterium]|nr:class I SAM-dependent methyltransferase [Nitrosomonadales bacterium]
MKQDLSTEGAPVIGWIEAGETRSARWRSENGSPPPKRVVLADDKLKADEAYRLACEGTALLWRGDFQNAKQMLQALARRAEPGRRKPARNRDEGISPREAFNLHRQAQSQRARILGMLLLPLDADYTIPLRRAPDVRQACEEAYGEAAGDSTRPSGQVAGYGAAASVLSLRELLGLIGAHEWHKKGVAIPALDARIHPCYGVFSPARGEYVNLVNEAPLPPAFQTPELAFDIGTGTGVLAAVLAMRGIRRVIATDQDSRALACARDNLARLSLSEQVEVVQADLFPAGRAPLIVCNPPWIPARPSAPIEYAIFDPDSRMLRGFLHGLAAHLEPCGEGWLVLSDIAEHLGLRTREELLALFDGSGLRVTGRIDVKPQHSKVSDTSDPLHAARAAEVTSLWRLAVKA